MSNDYGEVSGACSPSTADDNNAEDSTGQTATDIVIGSRESGAAVQDNDSVPYVELTEEVELSTSPHPKEASEDGPSAADKPNSRNIDETKAAAAIATALDTTVDTATSVDASDEEAAGSLSVDGGAIWDPFGLLSTDQAEDVGKNIRVLRRKCLATIICIVFFALVGASVSLSNKNRGDKPDTAAAIANATIATPDGKYFEDVNTPSSQPVPLPSSSSRPAPTPSVKENASTNTSLPTVLNGAETSNGTSEPTYAPNLTPSILPPIGIDAITNEPLDEPSRNPATTEPTEMPTNEPSNHLPILEYVGLPQYDTFSFYVTGDAPYTEAEEDLLREQLAEISNSVTDEDMFLLHVGDLMRAKTTFCQRRNYQLIEDVFTQQLPNLPVFLIPGDNDWNDCPDPDLAWQYWEDYLMAFERNFMGIRSYLPFVERQSVRQENLAFVLNGVLIIGLNQVAGIDDVGYEERLDHNIAWIGEQADKYQDDMASGSGRIRLCIVFAHSGKGARVFRHAKRKLSEYSFPTLVLKGDGHTFNVSNNLRDIGQDFGWDLFKAVQVDQGGKAPPMRITIQGTTAEALKAREVGLEESENVKVFWDFVRLDRRGGVYSTFLEAEDIDDE